MVFEALKSKNEYRFCQFINGLNSGIDFFHARKPGGIEKYLSFHLQVHLKAEEQPVSVF